MPNLGPFSTLLTGGGNLPCPEYVMESSKSNIIGDRRDIISTHNHAVGYSVEYILCFSPHIRVINTVFLKSTQLRVCDDF
jgi:hypothetical protein